MTITWPPRVFSALVPLLLVLLPPVAKAQYCAFEVVVKSSSGAPLPGVTVSAVSGGHQFAVKFTNELGIARICDSPVSLVDIEVGGRLCGSVAVRYLNALWMRTREVPVTYKDCQGGEWFTPGGCMFTIRVRDLSGSPIEGAVFGGQVDRPARYEQTKISDSFGRIFRFVDYHGALEGLVEKNGYLPRPLKESCEPGSDTDREQVVILGEIKR